MRVILSIIFIFVMQNTTIYHFNKKSTLENWRILDDVVMGGRSNGQFKLTEEGYGYFHGYVSLDNNGGFSSVRYNFETKTTEAFSSFVLKLKGDGKSYQFRVKDSRNNRYSYIYNFKTSGDWETIEIPFKDMFASYRGYRLDLPNYHGKQMEEIAFLIGNKKEEAFELLIESVMIH